MVSPHQTLSCGTVLFRWECGNARRECALLQSSHRSESNMWLLYNNSARMRQPPRPKLVAGAGERETDSSGYLSEVAASPFEANPLCNRDLMVPVLWPCTSGLMSGSSAACYMTSYSLHQAWYFLRTSGWSISLWLLTGWRDVLLHPELKIRVLLPVPAMELGINRCLSAFTGDNGVPYTESQPRRALIRAWMGV